MTEVDRRHFLTGTASLAALPILQGCRKTEPPATVTGDAAVEKMLAGMAEELLVEYPESASALGLDKDARTKLKSMLSDRSLAGNRRRAASAARRLEELKKVDRNGLSAETRIDLGVAQTAHELAADGYRFPFGDMVMLNPQLSYRNAPYAMAQNFGAFVEIPDLLDSAHSIAAPADAEAYLQRMQAYAAALDGETARLEHDRGLGVVAPAFLLDKTLRQMKAARAGPVAEWSVVTSLTRRTSAIGKDFRRPAETLTAEKIAPAMDRQIAELERHRAVATQDAGAWKLPDGEAYYAWALRAATTSNRTPEEVHQVGLEQVKSLAAEMDPLLRAEGLTKGTVGQRMAALGKDPRFLFPNDDTGRAQILAYVNDRVDDIRKRLPRAFATLVPGRLVVKRVPPEIEAGAPGGYAAAGAIDGSTPGNYYINLRDTSIWPKYALPTLTYHEGLPGHIWQGEYTYKLPLIRSLLAFNAYSEGWALYAEQLADELGVYEADPIGRLGYLQSMSFRACRLVVDTGLHAKRWTRDQAIKWFAETNGSSLEEVSSEVDRYCAWPGQACGYKVGHNEINRLRRKAIDAMGGRYDLRSFDDAVVGGGAVPMTLLEGVIDAYIASGRG
ncbi:DUF885 domain-containing protein [Sphingosinicella rhizophila]|uniref:DUF885 family protein n=1 Tax=Sphingosinicella rhizophila TaxID=3050082 RepID=A0ABU3Q2U3_9SPHN|nr:DUF885 family protein [Sphingosinicella sp. GR2756]MDT9597736.1 DUF885 family protein [Sphingosinicella sp. GR2756]